MLARPRKRIWPSLIRIARSNAARQLRGLMNGSRPSSTSTSATAASSTSQPSTADDNDAPYRRGAAGNAAPAPRIARKNSLPGSTIMTSFLLRKLVR